MQYGLLACCPPELMIGVMSESCPGTNPYVLYTANACMICHVCAQRLHRGSGRIVRLAGRTLFTSCLAGTVWSGLV